MQVGRFGKKDLEVGEAGSVDFKKIGVVDA